MNRKAPIGFEIRALNNRILRCVENAFDKVHEDGITATNGWIIGFLAANPDQAIYQKDLEAKFSITRSTASKVLILMEKKGLIERHSVPHDARLKRLVLTEKALRASQQMTANMQEFERMLIAGIDPEELEVLNRCLEKMKANLS